MLLDGPPQSFPELCRADVLDVTVEVIFSGEIDAFVEGAPDNTLEFPKEGNDELLGISVTEVFDELG